MPKPAYCLHSLMVRVAVPVAGSCGFNAHWNDMGLRRYGHASIWACVDMGLRRYGPASICIQIIGSHVVIWAACKITNNQYELIIDFGPIHGNAYTLAIALYP